MSEESGEQQDPTLLRNRISERVDALFELNQRLTTVLRDQAKSFENIGITCSAMSNQAFEIAELIGQLGVVAAVNVGNIIIADLSLGEDDDGEEEEEDE